LRLDAKALSYPGILPMNPEEAARGTSVFCRTPQATPGGRSAIVNPVSSRRSANEENDRT
jgi:hypothetical protein